MARPLAEDRDQKRLNILKTSAKVFAEAGISRASMSEVANACGVSKGSIYYYYSSKEALVFDILESYLSTLENRLLGLEFDGLSADEKLRLFCRETLLSYEGMDHEHKIQTEGISLLSTGQQQILKDHQRKIVQQLSDLLQVLNSQAFQDPAYLRSSTMAVFGMLNWYFMWNHSAPQDDRLNYADLVADMAHKGVCGLNPTP